MFHVKGLDSQGKVRIGYKINGDVEVVLEELKRYLESLKSLPTGAKIEITYEPKGDETVALFLRLITTFAQEHNGQRPTVEDLQDLTRRECGSTFSKREIQEYGRKALESMIH